MSMHVCFRAIKEGVCVWGAGIFVFGARKKDVRVGVCFGARRRDVCVCVCGCVCVCVYENICMFFRMLHEHYACSVLAYSVGLL